MTVTLDAPTDGWEGCLTVSIDCCRNLPRKSSDPYCKLEVGDFGGNLDVIATRKTKRIKSTASPDFKEVCACM